ncbi:nitroreductase family protein [Cellvibrio japonicus]|nr:nitroreductase family protein [Cellvibrio japonicus]QEI12681.1 nitroreductase family protein [Cellvibrio japonicus]QEI16255.1 nitroreductase family protein [Cellvibrio japonicus]QEI19833.1 nitroreductase family protein [Cellvibrio japonicus]
MTSDMRIPDYEVHPIFVARWSPRSFSNEVIDDATLFSLFEAARWAPSGNNSQPWRFIYARRDSIHWDSFADLLNEKNRLWASKASALVILVSKTTHVRKGASEATPLRNHSLDAGAAWANLALQAEFLGWKTHAIGGFDREKARELLQVPAGFQVELAIAVGKQGDATSLAEEFLERERPTPRNPVNSFTAEGIFSFADDLAVREVVSR